MCRNKMQMKKNDLTLNYCSKIRRKSNDELAEIIKNTENSKQILHIKISFRP